MACSKLSKVKVSRQRERCAETKGPSARHPTRPSPHQRASSNSQTFLKVCFWHFSDLIRTRGAIRKGNWKLVKIALLPELFDLWKDPGEQNNVADQFLEIAADLEA